MCSKQFCLYCIWQKEKLAFVFKLKHKYHHIFFKALCLSFFLLVVVLKWQISFGHHYNNDLAGRKKSGFMQDMFINSELPFFHTMVCTYVCTTPVTPDHMQEQARTHTGTHARTQAHTHTHTHAHTHTFSSKSGEQLPTHSWSQRIMWQETDVLKTHEVDTWFRVPAKDEIALWQCHTMHHGHLLRSVSPEQTYFLSALLKQMQNIRFMPAVRNSCFSNLCKMH